MPPFSSPRGTLRHNLDAPAAMRRILAATFCLAAAALLVARATAPTSAPPLRTRSVAIDGLPSAPSATRQLANLHPLSTLAYPTELLYSHLPPFPASVRAAAIVTDPVTAAPAKLPPTVTLTRAQLLHRLRAAPAPAREQAAALTRAHVQQVIALCAPTSLAHALSGLLGCADACVTVDDAFDLSGASLRPALHAGETLAQTTDMASRVLSRVAHGALADWAATGYHFEKTVTVAQLRAVLQADSAHGLRDVLLANIHSGVAHDWPAGQGGGHFVVIAGYDAHADEALVADVNPAHYGAYWAVPVARLHAAMRTHARMERWRGLVRLSETETVKLDGGEARVPLRMAGDVPRVTVVDPRFPPPPLRAAAALAYAPAKARDLQGMPNLAGLSAVAAALLRLGAPGAVGPYWAHRALHVGLVKHVGQFDDVATVAALLEQGAVEGVASGLTPGSVSVTRVFGAESAAVEPVADAETLRAALTAVRAARGDVVVLAPVRLNATAAAMVTPYSGFALWQGDRSWVLVADAALDADADDRDAVLLNSPHQMGNAGRFWTTSLADLAAGMRAMAADMEPALVVVDAERAAAARAVVRGAYAPVAADEQYFAYGAPLRAV